VNEGEKSSSIVEAPNKKVVSPRAKGDDGGEKARGCKKKTVPSNGEMSLSSIRGHRGRNKPTKKTPVS